MLLTGRLLIDPSTPPEPGWIVLHKGFISELGFGKPLSEPDLRNDESLICPGFIDAHIHLPQIQSIGCDCPNLLQWLEQSIYPAETGWEDPNIVISHVQHAYQRMMRSGTLGFAGYLTSHEHGRECLQSTAKPPLRARVGLSLMDRAGPDALIRTSASDLSIPPAEERLSWTVNPRFAVSCSEELLAAAGRYAEEGAFVQTHLSESHAECELVSELFPDADHYTAVYERHRLVGERSLLAHCLHLSDPEWRLIADRRAVVVHCPAANIFLRSGLFDLDAARQYGVRLALGSDVAAGPDIAMPRVARAMIETAKIRAMTTRPEAYIPTAAEAWRLITEGNADALGWPDAGRIQPGAAADLLILNPHLPIDDHLVSRLIHTWRDDYITHRIVAGAIYDLEDLDAPAG